MNRVIYLNEKDNVATVLADFEPGCTIECGKYTISTQENIPFGHKVSLAKINAGEEVVKYGEIIGVAKTDIPAGCCVHVHNIASLRGTGK